MSRSDRLMALALAGSLSLSALLVAATRSPDVRGVAAVAAHSDPIVDALGVTVRRREFRRIASGSILADRLLLELCEPERIVGLSQYGFEGSPVAFRYGQQRARVDTLGDPEALIALRPDLLLVNNFIDRRRIERLRESGLVVFELGDMRGLDSLLSQIKLVADLLGQPARGVEFARGVTAKLAGVATDIPSTQRKSAMYLGVHGTQFYGGARATSYHDVLSYAGLTDRAAERYEGWPAYSSEDILALDPEVIVTPIGQAAALCTHGSLDALRACGPNGKVVEVDGALLVDPGLAMIDAAIAVRNAVYGPIGSPVVPVTRDHADASH